MNTLNRNAIGTVYDCDWVPGSWEALIERQAEKVSRHLANIDATSERLSAFDRKLQAELAKIRASRP